MSDYFVAIKKLGELDDKGDPEQSHCEAEDIVMAYLRHTGADEVANAFEAARDRVGFWYA